MSLKKFFWMFAIGACFSLFSAETASACANDRLSHDSHEHAAPASKSVAHKHAAVPSVALKSEPEAGRAASKTVNAKPTATTPPATTKTVKATATTATLQGDDEFDMEAGACIHGCSCTGRTSHRSGCGTNGDCHAHEGLICTW